jgi:hypothetical protein
VGDIRRRNPARRATALAWSIVSLVGCKPSGAHEADPGSPVRSPRTTPDVGSKEAEDDGGEGPREEPQPGPVADSAMPEHRRIVESGAQSGLATFAREMPDAGLVWVGPLEGNGGRDVLVHVPPGADDRAEFLLVYHFHGTYSESVEKEQQGRPKKEWVGWNRLEQTLEAAADLQKKAGFNVALVYPLSAGKRREPDATGWWNGAYDRMWMMPAADPDYRDSFDQLHAEVRAILRDAFGVHASKLARPVIVEGHSAGGIALRNIAAAGTKVVGEYIFQDASFQTWADGCYEAVRSGKSSGTITLVITSRGIADPVQGRDPWCTRLEAWTQAWGKHRAWCGGKPDRKPSGEKATCAELETAAQEWPAFTTWCEGMKNDMQDVPEVYVHRTRIPHGKQPRHFTGGLELPPERHGD